MGLEPAPIPNLRQRSRYLLMVVTLLLLAAFIWTRNRQRPLITHYARDEIQWVTAAENYDQYGILRLRLQPIITPYAAPAEDWKVYQTSPPGPIIATYLTWSLFGRSPFAARLAPIFASLIGFSALANLTRRLQGRDSTLMTLIFFALSPLMVYYSGNINYEQFMLPLFLVALILLERWWRTGEGISALSVLAATAVWFSYFWFILLTVMTAFVWYFDKQRAAKLMPVWVASLLSFLVIIGLAFWQNPHFFDVLRDGFERRAIHPPDTDALSEAVEYLLRYLWLPTPVVTLLTGFGLWSAIRAPATDRLSNWIPAFLVATTLSYNALFWQATTAATYFPYLAIASMFIWAGTGWQRLWSRHETILWRSLVGSLLIVFLYGSWHWGTFLHGIEEMPPETVTWGEVIRSLTGPQDTIATNLPENGDLLEYHTRRRVEYEIAPSEIEVSTTWPVYLHCGEPALLWMHGTSVYVDQENGCQIISLTP